MDSEGIEARLRAAYLATADVPFGPVASRDAPPTVSVSPRRQRRRAGPAAIAALCASAAVGATLVAINIGSSADQAGSPSPSTSGAQGSCVAPFLRSDARRSPPEPGHPTTLGEVKAGSRVSVYGYWYYPPGCTDTFPFGATPPPVVPAASVRLFLTTASGEPTLIATVRPHGPDAMFTARMTIPTTASTGPATINDGHGEVVRLLIHK